MRLKVELFAIAAGLVTAASLIAGGIAIELGKPSANPEAEAKHAVLVVRGYACTAPEKTSLKAVAEGVVDGKRRSIPLELIPLAGQNLYAVARQWPAQGNWVLAIVESNPHYNLQPSVIVKVDGDTVDWAGVKHLYRAPAAQEIETALNATTSAKLQEHK